MTNPNAQIKDVLESLVHDAGELGLQVAAYLNSELVIDTWAGIADAASERPVDDQTLFTAFSISKGITATCVHVLADRGLVDYDAPIATYWPEFGANGKQCITVRHALTHCAGIPQDPPGFDLAMATDWDAVCRATAALEPLWQPGTKTAYHALTYGWMLGELVHRVDGRPISRFLHEEVSRPLGIGGMHFGVPEGAEHHVATLKNAPGMRPLDLAPTPSLSDPADLFNLPAVRRAAIPGAGALVNARSVARHYAMLANGGELDGVRVLSRAQVDLAVTPEFEASAATGAGEAPWFARHALGYTWGGGPGPMEGRTRAFGYEGLGTVGFADPSRGFAFAFLKNLLDWSENEMTAATIVTRAVEGALGIA